MLAWLGFKKRMDVECWNGWDVVNVDQAICVWWIAMEIEEEVCIM
jgi:hypothetical protein